MSRLTQTLDQLPDGYPQVFNLIEVDGGVGLYVAVADLDEADRHLLEQFLSPQFGFDGQEYFDLAQLRDMFANE